ncbi:ABC transporter ATP-binding protein [Zavarzinia sp.]|uniref:ABC transporter ATP-binding protein n=1 Tax=Zavarzinia sp. TaxID=2027920 RepID=UPI003BB4FA89
MESVAAKIENSPRPADSGPAKAHSAPLWRRLWAPYRGMIATLVLCQIVQSLSALLLPTLSADIINIGILRGDMPYIARMGGLMLGAAATQILFSVAAAWLGARIAMGFGRDLRSAVFARVQLFSLHEMRRFGTPSLITRSTNDVLQVQTFLVMVLTTIVTAPIMGIGGVLMAIHQDPGLSSILGVSVPALAVLVGILMALALPQFARMQGQFDRINQIVREQIVGLRVIRAFVRDDHEHRRFAVANDALTATALRVGRTMALNMPLAHLVMHLTAIALVWFAAGRIIAGTLEVGALVAFLAYIMQILISVMIASMLFVMAPRAVVSARRIRDVLETSSSVVEAEHPADVPPGVGGGVEIEFRDVTFAYPGAERPILQGIDFRLEPGKTLAVIGATGSGKTTIVNLIARLFDVTGGSIRVNGLDIRALSLDRLWSLIGFVPQESFLFSGTIADNLRYGRAEASDDELWQALEVAQARDFVSALPQGLAAPVAQGGGNFSGGQRQRLAIARALVRRAPVNLFDDSFSALDYATDARLRAALAARGAGSATLIVGQRVSSVRHADRILLLDQGTVAASGNHEELMRDCAAYREIVASQNADEAIS